MMYGLPGSHAVRITTTVEGLLLDVPEQDAEALPSLVSAVTQVFVTPIQSLSTACDTVCPPSEGVGRRLTVFTQ